MNDDAKREKEFDQNDNTTWGWDGYHVEDVVSFARMFRRQRDALQERLDTILAREP